MPAESLRDISRSSGHNHFRYGARKRRLGIAVAVVVTLSTTLLLLLGIPTALASAATPTQNQSPSTFSALPPRFLSSQETLTVPADGSSVQSQSLESGATYTATISGTYVWGGCDPVNCPNGGPDYIREGDAAFLTDDHFASFADSFWSSFIYFEINGNKFTSEGFNPRHVYTTKMTGNGSPATFVIRDCSYCYPDNSGSLKVKLIKDRAPFGPNGCSGVFSEGANFNFRDACNFHDLCYMDYTYGKSEAGRFECDRLFYNRMVSHCKTAQPSSAQAACLRQADRYAHVLVTGAPWFWLPIRALRAGPPSLN